MGKAFNGTASQTEEGLWVARRAQQIAIEVRSTKARPGLLQRTNRTETVYGPTGRPIAKVKVSDWGNSEHEFDDHQDAVVRPRPVKASLAEAFERIAAKGLPPEPAGPPGLYDNELEELRRRLESRPHDRDLWVQYRGLKSKSVAALQSRKAARDKALRG